MNADVMPCPPSPCEGKGILWRDRQNLRTSKTLLQAFLAASLKTDDELIGWFKERLVWDNTETVVEMLKSGLFVRAYEPQARFCLSIFTGWLPLNQPAFACLHFIQNVYIDGRK